MTESNKNTKLWGGRFNSPTNLFVEEFTASVKFDQRLALYDIEGSVAHTKMLSAAKIISSKDKDLILSGLQDIRQSIIDNTFQWTIALEDVHMNIEHALISSIGDTGKKLHTGRSRNDQVATDIRLYLRAEVDLLVSQLESLLEVLIDLAEREADTLMPGYTHLQVAQPITFGHHMLAWHEMIVRDVTRLKDSRKRINILPLGSGALAGTTFPIDRKLVAELLDFEGISENSLDAVSDRDFVIEFLSNASLTMMHYSRISEELVLWNSQAYSFILLDDAFCTGSSMMPQKKNPDVPELIRGKTGRVYGSLTGLLTLMKSQPLAYNKDNQEDKEPLFDAVDTLSDCTRALLELIPSLKINKNNMRTAAAKGFITATDLADYLVKQNIPFRDAHEIVGRVVARALEKNCELDQLDEQDFKNISSALTHDIYDVLNMNNALIARGHHGGTAPSAVQDACKRARKRLKNH
jgi:argininosuccinate lyase